MSRDSLADCRAGGACGGKLPIDPAADPECRGSRPCRCADRRRDAPSFPPPSGSASDRVAVSLPSPLTAEEAARKAASAERKGDTACVDLYAWAALQCWPTLQTPGVAEKKKEQAWKLYHDSLEKLIASGLKFQRLDPQRGFDVQTPSGTGGRLRSPGMASPGAKRTSTPSNSCRI